jgi:hypothetical protein
LIARIDSSEQRLVAALAHHTAASHEAMLAQLAAIGEPYADLPGRVSRLEAAVFVSRRR